MRSCVDLERTYRVIVPLGLPDEESSNCLATRRKEGSTRPSMDEGAGSLFGAAMAGCAT
jgi:hypothetical protein